MFSSFHRWLGWFFFQNQPPTSKLTFPLDTLGFFSPWFFCYSSFSETSASYVRTSILSRAIWGSTYWALSGTPQGILCDKTNLDTLNPPTSSCFQQYFLQLWALENPSSATFTASSVSHVPTCYNISCLPSWMVKYTEPFFLQQK